MTIALRTAARVCLDAALAAVDPERLTHAARDVREHHGPVFVVAVGKAAIGMARGAGLRPGIAIVPHGSAAPLDGIDVRTAGHPLPDVASEDATRVLLARLRAVGPDTLVVVLLSGGASALLAAPAAGLTLDDKRLVTQRLLASGADIAAMNVVRRHCSRVKGGGLARAAAGAAAVRTLILSDVVGDDPSVIASGPTVADPTTFADADAVLRRWLAPSDVPPAVRAHVDAGMAGRVPETVKPGDPILARGTVRVLAGNRTAVDAAAAAARAQGFAVDVVAAPLAGDAAAAGRAVVARLAAAPRNRAVAVVLGGETTVRVVSGGVGGRSQQLALSAALALAGRPGVVLAAGTDGVDGPTDAAGACVDGETVARARAQGLDAADCLARTASHACLDAAGDLLRSGPTGTNVADLVVALRYPC